jgi:hypothetical protein
MTETWQSVLGDALPLLSRRGVKALADQLRRGGPDLCAGVTVEASYKDGAAVRACPLAYAAAEGDLACCVAVERRYADVGLRLPDPTEQQFVSRLWRFSRWWDDLDEAGYGEDAAEALLEVLEEYLEGREGG